MKYSNNKIKLIQLPIFCLLGLFFSNANSLTYEIQSNSDIVGQVRYTHAKKDMTLGELGRKYDIGFYEMIEANPDLDPWDPQPGKKVTIPSRFILPAGPREGIVINLAEMRLYYYHPKSNIVTTHPIGVGKHGWMTPLMTTKIVEKKENPAWYPPKTIRAEYEKHGQYLPKVIPPGPDNPLGDYMMRLGDREYLIHGTNMPRGVGIRSSSGCIRMFPEDIQSLYQIVPIGTKVRIIHSAYKVGIMDGQTYMEAHNPLGEDEYGGEGNELHLQQAIKDAMDKDLYIQRSDAAPIIRRSTGIPTLLD